MSNSLASFSFAVRGCDHPDSGDTPQIPWTVESNGDVTVPNLASSGTTYTIPFGSIATEATYAEIRNNLAYDIYLKINGATMNYRLAPGAVFIHVAPVAGTASTGKLKAITATLTHNQAGVGKIAYQLLGDPAVD